VAAPISPLPAVAPPRPAPQGADRYRLHVVAANIADVVASIGGLIFDRAMAGWDVTVAVDGAAAVDDRPIRILGARVAPSAAATAPRPQALAIATDVFVANERLRRLTLAARNAHATDVLLWGRRHAFRLNCGFVPVRHRPSAAAQVFKSHALGVRGDLAAQPGDEAFYSVADRRSARLAGGHKLQGALALLLDVDQTGRGE
jgi:hypothetical protein